MPATARAARANGAANGLNDLQPKSTVDEVPAASAAAPPVTRPAAARDHESLPAVPSSGTTTSTPAAVAAPKGTARCLVRTRIPTRFGADCYVHLYENSLDGKQHLALVFGQTLRSASLDAVIPGESDADRLLRGAAIADTGALLRAAQTTKAPNVHARHASAVAAAAAPAEADLPLVRLHSECYTGETIGSVRCDCGDQLDEAMRLMARHGSGVIVYLRQEGRGIGLLEKLRYATHAFRLQPARSRATTRSRPTCCSTTHRYVRTYHVASLMLRDLGVTSVRLLTNNPDKLEQLTNVGIRVVSRTGMVPTHWARAHAAKHRHHKKRVPNGAARLHHIDILAGRVAGAAALTPAGSSDDDDDRSGFDSQNERANGTSRTATKVARSAIGNGAAGAHDDSESDAEDNADDENANGTVYPEMEAYLRTKVERMRHMIDMEARAPSRGPV
ncbi:GTP cyclohydrolase II [Allomyces macrogynus ATCC 38327]|uniref:GTP cyclohydrolase II n=1 Tax=Allomyces macrogynus (strain ATCC 38327) TaxID=578462 RepID=A0A0L0SJ89_ALLM3|nr:GTP cyclohydrolase II [Allomyces macrogynus ATCC 38327]|eukprot:KNE62568.1 GTP cyclohydrolase II [Allomyces macrogynus ATCC 38327]